MSRAQERRFRRLAPRLARELGWTQAQVEAALREAADADLIRLTRNGVEATIPARDHE